MNLIEIILHIVNANMRVAEAEKFLTELAVEKVVCKAILDSMGDTGFVFSDNDCEQIFPLKYIFVDGNGDEFEWDIENCVNAGTPVGEDDEDMEWTGRVVQIRDPK